MGPEPGPKDEKKKPTCGVTVYADLWYPRVCGNPSKVVVEGVQAGWPWMGVVSPRDIRREIATIRLTRGALRGYGVSL